MLQMRSAAALARALDQPGLLEPDLRALLVRRGTQLGPEGLSDTWFAVIGPTHGLADVEKELAFTLVEEGEPTFDWIERHPGEWYELAFCFGDLTHVVLVQDRPDADAVLVDLCRNACGQDGHASTSRLADQA